MPHDAALDSSFWIDAFRAQIVDYLPDDYVLRVPPAVVEEIEQPISTTGQPSAAGAMFKEWREAGKLHLEEPAKPVDWFQAGENAAIALAIEHGYRLLLDDNPPYHRATEQGIKIVSTADFIAALYGEGRLNYTEAVARLKATDINKDAMRKTLELIARIAQAKGERP